MKKDLLNVQDFLHRYSQVENWQEFMELFFQTKDYATGILTPLKLTTMQQRTYDSLMEQYKERKLCDALIIKGRRGQQSSLISGLACCYALFNPNSSIYVVADLQENAKKILSNYYTLYLDTTFVKNLLGGTYGLKPDKTMSISTESIHLCNGSNIKIASMMGASQADRASIGAGDAIKFLHITEYFGEYSAIEKTFDAMTLHNAVNVFCIRESTPRPNCAIHQDYINTGSQFSTTKVLFYPWWLDPKNIARIEDYRPSPEVLQYAETYNPKLTREQMAFMDLKLAKSTMKSFNEEYPATPELAFMQDTEGFYFEPDLISKCMKQLDEVRLKPHDTQVYPVVIGLDPAYTGKDKCAIVVRQGMYVHEIRIIEGQDSQGIFSFVFNLVKEYSKANLIVRRIFIDKTGSDGLVVMLRESLGSSIVKGVAFGEKPMNEARYLNKGAEMIDLVKDAMQEGLSLPYNKNLATQLSNMKFEYTLKSQLKREPKENLKKRIGMSPDELDALALSFAYPVPIESVNYLANNNYYSNNQGSEDCIDIFKKNLLNM